MLSPFLGANSDSPCRQNSKQQPRLAGPLQLLARRQVVQTHQANTWQSCQLHHGESPRMGDPQVTIQVRVYGIPHDFENQVLRVQYPDVASPHHYMSF